MKWAIFVAILLGATSGALAQIKDLTALFPPLENIYAPPTRVSGWISIQWVGDMNHPIIPVYYSVERGGRPDGSSSRYVTMTGAEYKYLSDFVHSYQCVRANKSERSLSIATSEFGRGRYQPLCIFARNPGCDFLFRLAALPGIDWSHKDTFPLYQFEAELGCKEPLTKSHDSKERSN